jgi:hypothetical protein
VTHLGESRSISSLSHICRNGITWDRDKIVQMGSLFTGVKEEYQATNKCCTIARAFTHRLLISRARVSSPGHIICDLLWAEQHWRTFLASLSHERRHSTDRSTVDMPNTLIRRDLQIPTVKEKIQRYRSQYSARLSAHPNGLIANLMELRDNRRLRRHLPNDLSTRFLVWLLYF